MKNIAKILSLLAATCFALAGSAQAQVVTYETVSAYQGSVINFGKGGTTFGTQGEQFTNVAALASMTFSFFTTSPNAASGGSLSAVFGQWNTVSNSFVAGTTLSFGTITVAAPVNWNSTITPLDNNTYKTASATLDFTQFHGGNVMFTDPNLTYAVLLTNTNAGATLNFGIGITADETAFDYGIGTFKGASVSGGDMTFAQIVLVPNGNVVPESSTMAAIAGAVLVAGLAAFRIRQRRQLSPALMPVA